MVNLKYLRPVFGGEEEEHQNNQRSVWDRLWEEDEIRPNESS